MREGVVVRRLGILFLWALGILLPVAWLAQLWPATAQAFGFVFGTLWAHVLMHALLFAVLGWLAMRAMGRAALRRRLVVVLLVVVAVALLQEAVQLAYKARPILADDVLDVGVDVAAGAVGVLASWRSRRRHNRKGSPIEIASPAKGSHLEQVWHSR